MLLIASNSLKLLQKPKTSMIIFKFSLIQEVKGAEIEGKVKVYGKQSVKTFHYSYTECLLILKLFFLITDQKKQN